MNNIAVHLAQISKYYKLYSSPKDRFKEALDPFRRPRHKRFFALNHIDLKIGKGEILGVVGRNGAGKSTLLKLIAGVIPPSSGQLTVNGNVSVLLELGSGLNPDLTGIQNIYFGGIMLGYPPEDMGAKIEEIVAFADIGDFINQPLKTYSSGMKARLGFALAVSINPDILIVDEVLSVGDELFRRKCYARMEKFFKQGKTVLFVSHDVQSINHLCTRAIMLDKGTCVLEGPPKMVTMYYHKILFSKKENIDKVFSEICSLNENNKQKMRFHGEQGCESPWGKDEAGTQALEVNKDEEKVTQQNNTRNVTREHQDQEMFLSSLVPQSTDITIDGNIKITGIKIFNDKKEEINQLIAHRRYHIDIQIITQEECSIYYSLTIRDIKGVIITGVNQRNDRNRQEINLKKGINDIHLTFNARFFSGLFYISASLYDEASNPIFSIKDITVFKVLNHNGYNVGFVDMFECSDNN